MQTIYFFEMLSDLKEIENTSSLCKEDSSESVDEECEDDTYSISNVPFSERTLSDEVFLQYLHDSPPIEILFVFFHCLGLSYSFDVEFLILRNLLV